MFPPDAVKVRRSGHVKASRRSRSTKPICLEPEAGPEEWMAPEDRLRIVAPEDRRVRRSATQLKLYVIKKL